MRKILLSLIFLVSFTQNYSQNSETDSCNCCTEKHYNFDFWLGNWTVYNTEGKVIGHNNITKLYDQCVLREEWESTAQNRGTSTNYYNKQDDSWNQVWVDNSGFSLVLKGGLVDGKMILKSELQKGKQGNYYSQISWIPHDDGTVTQLWEYYKEDNTLIQEAFRGLYKKDNK